METLFVNNLVELLKTSSKETKKRLLSRLTDDYEMLLILLHPTQSSIVNESIDTYNELEKATTSQKHLFVQIGLLRSKITEEKDKRVLALVDSIRELINTIPKDTILPIHSTAYEKRISLLFNAFLEERKTFSELEKGLEKLVKDLSLEIEQRTPKAPIS